MSNQLVTCSPRPNVGADLLAGPGNQGVWLKTHIRRHGHYVTATMYTVSPTKDGVPDLRVFRATVDVRPIMRQLKRLHDAAHSADRVSGDDIEVGLFRRRRRRGRRRRRRGFSLKRLAKKAWKAGKSKAVRKVWNTTRGVLKSDITKGVVAATAVAFPAVGVPAAAALATANTALNQIEKGRRVAGQIEKTVGNLAKGKNIKGELLKIAKQHGKPYLKQYLRDNPQLAAFAKQAMQYKRQVEATINRPEVKSQIRDVMRQYRQAKKFVNTVNQQATTGTGRARVDAQKMQAVLRIAAANRQKIKRMTSELEGGTPGLVVDSRGRFQGGRWQAYTGTGTPDVLVSRTGTKHGHFRRVPLDPEKVRQLAAYRKRQEALELRVKKLRGARSQATPIRRKRVRARKKTILRRLKRRLSRMAPAARRVAVANLKQRLAAAKRRVQKRREPTAADRRRMALHYSRGYAR